MKVKIVSITGVGKGSGRLLALALAEQGSIVERVFVLLDLHLEER